MIDDAHLHRLLTAVGVAVRRLAQLPLQGTPPGTWAQAAGRVAAAAEELESYMMTVEG